MSYASLGTTVGLIDLSEAESADGPAGRRRRGRRSKRSKDGGTSKVARGGVATILAEALLRVSQSICFFYVASVLPTDQLGTAAIAFVVMLAVATITDFGLGPTIQALGPDRRRDQTAVGIAFVTGISGGLVVFATAPLIAGAFGDEGATNVIRVAAFMLPVQQWAEVGTAIVNREMQFAKTANIQIVASVLSVVACVVAVQADAGPSAIIIQHLTLHTCRCLLLSGSFFRAGFPRIHRVEARVLWRTTREVMGSAVLNSMYINIDNAVVGQVSGPTALGIYNFMYNIINVPMYVLLVTVRRMTIPIYVRLLRIPKALRSAVLRVLIMGGWANALAMTAVAINADLILTGVYGDKWSAGYNTMRILGVYGILRFLLETCNPLLLSAGKEAVFRRIMQWQTAAMVVLVVPLTIQFGQTGTACAATLPLFGGLTAGFISAARTVDAKPVQLFRTQLEPLLAGVLLNVAIHYLSGFTEGISRAGVVVALIAVGSGGLLLVRCRALVRAESFEMPADDTNSGSTADRSSVVPRDRAREYAEVHWLPVMRDPGRFGSVGVTDETRRITRRAVAARRMASSADDPQLTSTQTISIRKIRNGE